jgi:hypothetical protein
MKKLRVVRGIPVEKGSENVYTITASMPGACTTMNAVGLRDRQRCSGERS